MLLYIYLLIAFSYVIADKKADLESVCDALEEQPDIVRMVGDCFDKEVSDMDIFKSISKCLGNPESMAKAMFSLCDAGKKSPQYTCVDDEIKKLEKNLPDLTGNKQLVEFAQCVAKSGILNLAAGQPKEQKYSKAASSDHKHGQGHGHSHG